MGAGALGTAARWGWNQFSDYMTSTPEVTNLQESQTLCVHKNPIRTCDQCQGYNGPDLPITAHNTTVTATRPSWPTRPSRQDPSKPTPSAHTSANTTCQDCGGQNCFGQCLGRTELENAQHARRILAPTPTEPLAPSELVLQRRRL